MSRLPLPLLPLANFLRLVPDRVHVGLLVRLADAVLRRQGQADALSDLEGKVLRLEVTDTGNRWTLRVQDARLRPAANAAADVRIRGALIDFLTLATRGEDPDTLFFQRRIEVEGDTETGLLVKYFIDAFELDLESQLASVLGPDRARRALARLARAGILDRGRRLADAARGRIARAGATDGARARGLSPG